METADASTTPLSAAEAEAALAAVTDDRRHLAEVLRRESRWYSPVYGTLVAGMLLAPAGPPAAFPFIVGASGLAFVALMTTYRARTRIWPRAESQVQVLATAAVMVLVVAGMGLTWAAWRVWDAPPLGVGVALLVGVGAGLLSSAFDRASAHSLERP